MGAPLTAGTVIRDPVGNHLLTPQNAALFVIDYQPSQFAAVRSLDRETAADVVEIVLTEQLLKA